MANKQFVSNRDIVVRSKSGHSIKFTKGKPEGVPEVMHSEVMEKGIMPVDDQGEVDTKHEIKLESKVVLAPEDGLERAKQILRVIEAIVARNNSKDFAGGGHPSAKAVSAALGWMTDQKEVSDVWKKHRETLLTEK